MKWAARTFVIILQIEWEDKVHWLMNRTLNTRLGWPWVTKIQDFTLDRNISHEKSRIMNGSAQTFLATWKQYSSFCSLFTFIVVHCVNSIKLFFILVIYSANISLHSAVDCYLIINIGTVTISLHKNKNNSSKLEYNSSGCCWLVRSILVLSFR